MGVIEVTHVPGGQVRARDGRVWRYDGELWFWLNERTEVAETATPRDMAGMISPAMLNTLEGNVMTRSRKSARDAGAQFERHVAEYLARVLADDRIERRVKNGAKDRGDIGGVRTVAGERLVIEVKNTSRPSLGPWVREAAIEAGNDDAPAGIVVHKRTGYGYSRMGEQFVTMRLRDLAVLLGGEPGEDV